MKAIRLFRFVAPLLHRLRQRRPPDWCEDFERIPSARARGTRRVFVAWSGTQMLPMAISFESSEADRDRRKW